jgi:dolichol-phosphate mannosyltransferase
MPDIPVAASVIVPAYREQPNLPVLVERTFRALREAGITAELIIVDDNSQDGTEETIRQLQADYPVRLIVRREERGLATAVMAGMAAAQHDCFVVLDADLQHPPEIIPALVRKLGEGGHDMVIGTRYGGGAIDEDWPFLRRLVSRVATLMARPLVRLSDPMSGFFAIPRSTWERAAELDPVGYKIALEIYVKGRCRHPGEVPIQFAARAGGESKLSFAEQVRYVRHLFRLYRFRFPWLMRVAVVAILIVLAALIWGLAR